MKEPAVLLLSGGPDSSTLAFDLVKNQGKKVLALTFNFGEKEAKAEIESAKKIAVELGIEHHIVDFSDSMREFYGLPNPQYMRKVAGPNLYSDETTLENSYDVQPFGSAIALLMAASWGLKQGARSIYYAVHYNDTIYFDNKVSYFKLLGVVTSSCEGDEYAMDFQVPYLKMLKSEVIALGHSLGLDLSETWSCASSDEIHCGTCEPCIDRREAFKQAHIADTTVYANNSLTVE